MGTTRDVGQVLKVLVMVDEAIGVGCFVFISEVDSDDLGVSRVQALKQRVQGSCQRLAEEGGSGVCQDKQEGLGHRIHEVQDVRGIVYVLL